MHDDDIPLDWPARAKMAVEQIVGGADGGDQDELDRGIDELRDLPRAYQQGVLDDLEHVKLLPSDGPERYLRPVLDGLLGGRSHALAARIEREIEGHPHQDPERRLVEYRTFGLPCAELGPGKHDFIAVSDIRAALTPNEGGTD